MDYKKNNPQGRKSSALNHVTHLPVTMAIFLSLIKVVEVGAIFLIVWKNPCAEAGSTFASSQNCSQTINPNTTENSLLEILSDLKDNLCVNGSTCELCPLNWVALDGSCYYFSEDRMEWSKSKNNCEQMRSDMLSIEDSLEKEFISNQVSSRKGHFWIGLKKKDGEWIWENGYKFKTELSLEHDCATFGKDISSESCSNPNKWICEKKAIVYPTTFTQGLL
ncbi:C-type lectin domain family 7 member A-like isoform 2-T2 [Discoglossus pictus]